MLSKQITKEQSKPNLPILALDTAYLDTNTTRKFSPHTTKNKSAKKRFGGFNNPYKTYIPEEDNIYKLSEIQKVKEERFLPEAELTKYKRAWEAYPQKKNLLQDVRRQYSAFLNTRKTQKLNETAPVEITTTEIKDIKNNYDLSEE